MALSRKQLVDYFFDTFPSKFQGDKTYWYEARGEEDQDFQNAFGEVFNNMGPEERKMAADFLFENDPERFQGDKTYWYTDRGAENQDFVNAFGKVFTESSDAVATPPGGEVPTAEGAPAEEDVQRAGVGGKRPETVSILHSKEMKWFFDRNNGKWYVSYKMPNSNRSLFFEATGSQLDAIFGENFRPTSYETIDNFQDIGGREGFTFGGDVGEVQGTGSFEAEVDAVVGRALDEGVLPPWARRTPEVMDLLFIKTSEGKSDEWLYGELRKLPSFKERFPGVEEFEALGLSLEESVESFLEFETGIKKVVARDGGDPAGITPDQVGALIAKGHSLKDVEFTFEVFDNMERNAGALSAFNQILEARGQAPLDDDDWFDFMAGSAPRDLYQIWEEASLHRAALDAGLGDLGVSGAIDLAARTEGLTSYDAALEGLSNAAGQLLQFRAEIALDRYGLDEQDLIDLSLGLAPSSGRSQAEIGRNIDRAVKSARATQEARRVNPFRKFTQEGVPQAASLSRTRQESA